MVMNFTNTCKQRIQELWFCVYSSVLNYSIWPEEWSGSCLFSSERVTLFIMWPWKGKKETSSEGTGAAERQQNIVKTGYAPCSRVGAAWLGEQTKATPSDQGLIQACGNQLGNSHWDRPLEFLTETLLSMHGLPASRPGWTRFCII